MKISSDTVVSIDYTVRDERGQVIDQSGDQPLAYLHGHSNIIPGLERALEGLEAGETTRASVQPGEGYGDRDEDRVLQVPRGELPPGMTPEVGMLLSGETPDGQAVPLWVTEIHKDHVTLDGNHPLAGKSLDFEVTVRGVRAATETEVEHGHVHGPGAHAHDSTDDGELQ